MYIMMAEIGFKKFPVSVRDTFILILNNEYPSLYDIEVNIHKIITRLQRNKCSPKDTNNSVFTAAVNKQAAYHGYRSTH